MRYSRAGTTQSVEHLPGLALKPRGDVARSPKQGYQWPPQKTYVLQKCFKKTKKT